MSKLLSILFAVLLGAAYASEEGGMVPNAARLVGVWIGLGDHGAPVYRLQLDSDGTGFLAWAETRMPAVVLRIEHWSLGGTNLAFAVSVLAPRVEATNSGPLSVTGNWHSGYVSDIITLERRASVYTNRVVLRKQDELDWLARVTKQATEAVRTNSTTKP